MRPFYYNAELHLDVWQTLLNSLDAVLTNTREHLKELQDQGLPPGSELERDIFELEHAREMMLIELEKRGVVFTEDEEESEPVTEPSGL